MSGTACSGSLGASLFVFDLVFVVLPGDKLGLPQGPKRRRPLRILTGEHVQPDRIVIQALRLEVLGAHQRGPGV